MAALFHAARKREALDGIPEGKGFARPGNVAVAVFDGEKFDARKGKTLDDLPAATHAAQAGGSGSDETLPPGVTENELLAACVGPDLDNITATAVLSELRNTCLYLHYDGVRYQVRGSPQALPHGLGLAIPDKKQIEALRRAVRYLLAIDRVEIKKQQLRLTKDQLDQLRERKRTEQSAAESCFRELYTATWLPRVQDGELEIEKVERGGRPLQATGVHERIMDLPKPSCMDDRRAQLRTESSGVIPEEVIVLETIGSVDDFIDAVRNVRGLEWLGEIEEENIPPDNDFFVADREGLPRPDKLLRGRLFLIFSNHQALQQMLSLFFAVKML